MVFTHKWVSQCRSLDRWTLMVFFLGQNVQETQSSVCCRLFYAYASFASDATAAWSAASSVTPPVEYFIRRVQITGLLGVWLHCQFKSADYIQHSFGFLVSDRSPSHLFVVRPCVSGMSARTSSGSSLQKHACIQMWKRPIAHIICMWILEHILVPTMGTFLKCYSFPITTSSQFDAYFSRSHFFTILCSLISDHLAPLPRSLPRPSVRRDCSIYGATIRSNAKTEEEGSAWWRGWWYFKTR